jgi:predicted PurR-regulated permease PerM
MIDNVVKMYVLQGRSQLHPLLALLSVLGGLQVFGPIGLLVGPMVVVFLQTLLEILNHERRGMLAESQDGGDDSSLPSAQPSFDPSS